MNWRGFRGILPSKLSRFLCIPDYMAEGEGFEPPVPFRVHRFSRPTVSTAHTSLRGCEKFINQNGIWLVERHGTV
jgi:hypothetical protein